MKKFFLLLMAVGAITLVSCDNKAKSSSASESESSESESCESKSCKSDYSESAEKNKEEAVKGLKYENADFGYSVVLPEGFEAQNNNAEMEKERGGKLFLSDGCSIDVTCSEMNYIGDTTPEASIDQSIEMVKALNEGAEVEKLDAVSFVSKSQDENYLRAQYEAQKNGKKYLMYFTYPLEKKDQFDKDVDAVVKSFVVK